MIITIHPKNPEIKKIESVVDCLKKGGVIIYPTDAVYSIGCDLMNARAVERVARIKGVAVDKSNFSLVCSELAEVANYVKPFDTNTFKILKKALPGPFTFILEANTNTPKIFKNKKKTIGIRIPDNKIVHEIVKLLGNPLIATSVHDDDEVIEYTTDPELIYEKYCSTIDLLVNGGYGHNTATTIVDLRNNEAVVVREGLGDIGVFL
jgi:tRNA threonylcarbamoyl adenosine modification protein (Sua5/YciO/YrdC/YwlC family)